MSVALVVDASVSAAWFLPDEATPYAEAALQVTAEGEVWVSRRRTDSGAGRSRAASLTAKRQRAARRVKGALRTQKPGQCA